VSITYYPQPVITVQLTETATDAFGRSRTTQPFTLFESQHRYFENSKWNTETATGGTTTHVPAESVVNLAVTTTSGSKVYRETKRVFAYQPGKSLLVMTTFSMSTPKTNLRQRVGYFSSLNGVYLENDGVYNYIVLRSQSLGSTTRIRQDAWNADKFDGTGSSGRNIDVNKTQILWMDIEWLGVGDIRVGFVVDGGFVLAHTFHNDNEQTTTYMTTAVLPVRYEIENTGTTASASTMKQICTTVISEGGFELTGFQYAVGTPITSSYTLTTAGTYYPVVSLRLKSTALDDLAILSALSLLGSSSAGVNYNWKIVNADTVTGGTWVSGGSNSSVEYNITGTATTGGDVVASGYVSAGTQSSQSIDISKASLFKFQLERNSFTSTPSTLTLIVAADTNTSKVYGSLDWEEVTR
jgi:hypothetical protein